MCTSSVSNVIYQKISHGAAFYTLNGKNVNVMLELYLATRRHTTLNDIKISQTLYTLTGRRRPQYVIGAVPLLNKNACTCFTVSILTLI